MYVYIYLIYITTNIQTAHSLIDICLQIYS